MAAAWGLYVEHFSKKSKLLGKAVDDLRSPSGPGISYLISPLLPNFHCQSQMSLASVMVTHASPWIMAKESSFLN